MSASGAMYVQPDPVNQTSVFRINSGSIAVGQSDLAVNGRMTCTGSPVNVPLFQVPAGKTFFLSDVQFSTVSASELDIQIAYVLTVGGTTVTIPIFRAAILNTSPCTEPGIESQPDAPGGSQVVLILPGVNAAVVDFDFSGFLQ